MSHLNPHGVPLLDIGRDVNGRFRPGNQGGPGNPFARKVASLRKALIDSVSEQDLKEMIEMLKLKARQGDSAAIKLILQYCVGKPASPKDPDRMDIDEWHRLQQMRVGHQQFQKTTEAMPACLACHLAATSWPCEAQDGPPLDESIHFIHKQLQAGGTPGTAPGKPRKDPAPPSARPHAAPRDEPATPTTESKAPSEPSAPPAAPRPSPAKGERESGDRPEPAGPSRDDRPSPTETPLPNGGNEEERQKALERLHQLRQRSQPSDQAERKPPRR